MPKSKRARGVALTKVKSNVQERKSGLVEKIQHAADEYKRAFVFAYTNMRSAPFKELRTQWAEDSRFFLGKNKVMQIALGRSKEDEFRPNLRLLARLLSGHVGLLFTNKSRAEVAAFFETFETNDFARAGSKATETVEVPAGPLDEMPHTQVQPLRKLGLPVELRKGVVICNRDFTVCEEGQVLKPNQTELLKQLGKKLAVFRVQLVGVWDAKGGKFEMLASTEGLKMMDEDDDEDEDEEEESEEEEEEEEVPPPKAAGKTAAAAATTTKGGKAVAAVAAAAVSKAAKAATPAKAAAKAAVDDEEEEEEEDDGDDDDDEEGGELVSPFEMLGAPELIVNGKVVSMKDITPDDLDDEDGGAKGGARGGGARKGGKAGGGGGSGGGKGGKGAGSAVAAKGGSRGGKTAGASAGRKGGK